MTPLAVIGYILFMLILGGATGLLAYSALCYIFQTNGTLLAVLGGLIGVLVVAFLDLKFTRPL